MISVCPFENFVMKEGYFRSSKHATWVENIRLLKNDWQCNDLCEVVVSGSAHYRSTFLKSY
jgi:hypothetical protein